MRSGAGWLVLCAACVMVDSVQAAATFQFRIKDDPGEGLNDPTPFLPEGGNTATTLGEARLKVLEEAGRIWGGLITSSITIVVDAKADPRTCGPGSISLAAAGPADFFRPGSGPQSTIYFPAALADSIAGMDLNVGSPDIGVTLNSSLHNNLSCANGARFYYGFDHNPGPLQPDLLQVVLHELGHGLGFTSVVSLTTGEGFTDSGVERLASFDQFIFDESLGQLWTALTPAQRLQSAVRSGSLAWNGTNANNARLRYTSGVTAGGRFLLYAPATISTGSSVSHWDISLNPDALMEPFLTGNNGLTDLTPCVLKDIGWTVTRCVDSANAIPLSQAQTISVVEDTPINITLGGSDADGDPLVYAVASMPAKGALSALPTTLPATTVYSPNQNSNGQDTFTFTVSDGSAISTAATVTLNITPVNDAPTAFSKTASVQSGKTVSIILTGIDVDGDALTFEVLTNPAHGTIGGAPPNITYAASAGFTGMDTFTYRAKDAATTSPTATVSVTVTAAPDSGGGNDGGGGGGGTTGLPLLALLGALLVQRRLREIRAAS